MSTPDHRAHAVEAVEGCESFDAIATVHAMLYLGDRATELAQAVTVLTQAIRDTEPRVTTAHHTADATLTPAAQPTDDDDTLEATEEVVMANGRVYRPAYDPRLWSVNPANGNWISPKGREFSPKSAQALGVIRRLEKMRANGTLYSTPIRYPEDWDGERA